MKTWTSSIFKTYKNRETKKTNTLEKENIHLVK